MIKLNNIVAWAILQDEICYLYDLIDLKSQCPFYTFTMTDMDNTVDFYLSNK